MSECWTAYQSLDQHCFNHLTANHSCNVVEPQTAAHTQHIERTWRDTRTATPSSGRSEEHMPVYIAEYLFKRMFEVIQMFRELNIYPANT